MRKMMFAFVCGC